MSSSTGYGHEYHEGSLRDDTFQIDAPFLPETPIDGIPRFSERDRINRDPRQGLISVPEENLPIPVVPERSLQAQRHSSRIGRPHPLWVYGLSVEKDISKLPSAAKVRLDGGLLTTVLLLLHMENVKLKGYVESSAFFVAKRLVMFPQVAVAYENPAPTWPTPTQVTAPSVKIYGSNHTAYFLWPAFQVAQVLYRLEYIAREAQQRKDIDHERQWAQLLVFFFIDIIDSCSVLTTFHTNWDVNLWLRIRQDYALFEPLELAFKTISSTNYDTVIGVARNVESWVYHNLLGPFHRDQVRTLLPPGEISQRIVRVWTKFHNMAIQVWQHPTVQDPRGNGKQLWDLPDLSELGQREYRPDPQRAIEAAGRRHSVTPQPLSPDNRRRSLPLAASSPTAQAPVGRHPHRSSLAYHPASHSNSPSPHSHFPTPPPPRVAPVVYATVGGPAYASSSVPNEFKADKRRKRDIIFPFLKKGGSRRDDGNLE
ncbi:hypothetical protein JCM5353_001530 [Sporobolomyces roseus]